MVSNLDCASKNILKLFYASLKINQYYVREYKYEFYFILNKFVTTLLLLYLYKVIII